MMSKDQAEIVKLVYARFIENESDEWTEVDDNLEFCNYLTDSELIREAEIKYESHCVGNFRCIQEHEPQFCFAVYILEAVEAILKLYENKKELHEKNRYILVYYVAMSALGMIYSV